MIPFWPSHAWIRGDGQPSLYRDRTAWIRRLDAMPSSRGLLISSRADVLCGRDAAGSSDAWERDLLRLGLGWQRCGAGRCRAGCVEAGRAGRLLPADAGLLGELAQRCGEQAWVGGVEVAAGRVSAGWAG